MSDEPLYLRSRHKWIDRDLMFRTAYPWFKSFFDSLYKLMNRGKLTLLDAGCGTGINTVYLSSRYSWDAVGIDLDLRSIQQALRVSSLQSGNLPTYSLGDILYLPFKNETFDVVLCSEVIEHLIPYKQVLEEIKRVLKKGGVLLLTTEVSCFAPLSINWIENKINKKILLDEYAGHVRRFTYIELAKSLEESKLRIIKVLLIRQYIQPLVLFFKTLLERRGKIFRTFLDGHDHLMNRVLTISATTLANLEFSLLKWVKRGSGIIIVCRSE